MRVTKGYGLSYQNEAFFCCLFAMPSINSHAANGTSLNAKQIHARSYISASAPVEQDIRLLYQINESVR